MNRPDESFRLLDNRNQSNESFMNHSEQSNFRIMEQLLKIGENENVGGEVELSEFEKKLEFARLGFSTA